MKKTILFLLVFCMLLTGLFAQNATHVTAERARNIGYTFMSTNPAAPASPTRGGGVSRDAMQLVYTGRAVDSTTRGTTDCYYVYALQPKGFVIVAADERVEPVLGYSYDNDFVAEGMPEHVRGWLDSYEQQIKAAIDQNLAPDAEITAKWTRLEAGQPLSNTRSGETVGPLLTTTWDQGQYYNALCPEDANGPDGHVWTGCVATAMAQLINYWGYPAHGRGTHSYESRYGTLTVNYDSARYDYANMPDALTDTSTPEQINAVATLMRDCGVAVNMMYSASESGAYDRDGRAALINFFRFSPDISYAEKDFFTPNEWLTLLRENLDNNRPVLYSGHGNVGGHTFICDGYNTDRYYHFNFGWSGNSDGWYLTDAVIEFNSEQTAIIGIVPDSTGNVILGQTSGISTFTVDDPLEFYHLLGHNTYEGENYSNECYSTTIFTAVDSAKQLVLDIVSFEEQYITVYDSIMGDELAFLFQLQPTPLLSNSSMMSLLYQGYFSYNGFHLSISQNNGCRMVSNVTTSVDATTIHLSWTENSDAIQWQVEYGLTGFQHGEGTLLTVDTTTINITGLTKFTTYDFYIRPVCDNRWFGPITETALAKYWTDVVTSQPEGYVEDEQGHIYISTAEGLAWLSKLAYEDQGSIYHPSHFVARHVTITNDINLGQYRWNPIAYFYGVFDGQGHRIDSMVCIENESENTSFAAMIRSIHWENHATLKNILLTNCWVKSKDTAAGLIALKSGGDRGGRDTIINCFVSGKIEGTGPGSVAPIAAQEYALIVNCASNCKIIGKGDYCSGILADGMNGGGPVIMKNCYSASSVRGYAWWTASVLGYGENATVENCYGFAYSLIAAGDFLSTFRDLEWFSETDSGFYLLQPILFDPDSLYYSNLKDVLNAGVRKCNWEELRVWVDDTADINGGMPILGPKYIPTCPNIQNLTAKNVEKQGRYGVELSWTETGEATTWEIKYHIQDSIDENHNPINEVRMLTMNNPDTLWDLSEQTTYLFSVRPVCSNTNRGGWSDEFAHVVDRAHWTKIITTQPEGYEEDAAGNVTISTAEGLAWLISTVNGLNGQTENHFEGKTVTLTQDVNIGQYRWTAINGFKGKFDGGNHSIRNLYINELDDNQGLFGLVDSGSYINIKLDSANVKGINHVGMLFGYINHAKCTFNCHVSGKVYGNNVVGGMAGGINYCETVNACSSFGKIIAKYSCAGGLIGRTDGGLFVGLIGAYSFYYYGDFYFYSFFANSPDLAKSVRQRLKS